MFQMFSNPKGDFELQFVKKFQYSVYSSQGGVCFHNISYDSLDEFEASLTIQAVSSRFNSLNFMYHPKGNKKRNCLTLNLAYINDDKVTVYCHQVNKQGMFRAFTLKGCSDLLSELKNNIFKVNDNRHKVDPFFEDLIADHVKNLIQKYILVVQSILDSEAPRADTLEKINTIMEGEAAALQNIFDINSEPVAEIKND